MDARELFEAARRAAVRIEEIHRLREAGVPPRRGGAGPSGDHGDPTARAAEWLLEALPDLACEEAACEEAVGEALAVVEGLRTAGMVTWAEVLDAYYIDGETWDDVAARMSVTNRMCRYWRDAALDWVDSMGFAATKAGRGCAE